jgi:predicted ATPase
MANAAHGAYYRKNPQAARLAFAGLTEEQTMKNFYDREISRVKYVGKRQVIRAAEKKSGKYTNTTHAFRSQYIDRLIDCISDEDAKDLQEKRSQASASHTFDISHLYVVAPHFMVPSTCYSLCMLK